MFRLGPGPPSDSWALSLSLFLFLALVRQGFLQDSASCLAHSHGKHRRNCASPGCAIGRQPGRHSPPCALLHIFNQNKKTNTHRFSPQGRTKCLCRTSVWTGWDRGDLVPPLQSTTLTDKCENKCVCNLCDPSNMTLKSVTPVSIVIWDWWQCPVKKICS